MPCRKEMLLTKRLDLTLPDNLFYCLRLHFYSHKVSRVSWYSGSCCPDLVFAYGAFTLSDVYKRQHTGLRKTSLYPDGCDLPSPAHCSTLLSSVYQSLLIGIHRPLLYNSKAVSYTHLLATQHLTQESSQFSSRIN